MGESNDTSAVEPSLSALLAESDRRASKTDAVLFVDQFTMTFDPRPDVIPHDIDFTLYPYQKDLVEELVDDILNGGDLFIEKSRDMGASWVVLAVFLWAWLNVDGFQALVGSRKEDYVDNGQIDSLFGKLDYLIAHIKDPLLMPQGFRIEKHRTYMKLVNPDNGNTIQGESSNKNFSRAGRYTVVFFDEFGFWPDARRSWQAAGDATKFRLAVTTPPDEPSYAKALRFSDRIKILTLHWRLHPKKDDDWYAYERTRRTDEEVLHELDISWEYSSVGRPYPEIKDCPVGQFEYDPSLPLYKVLDIGLDAVAIGWWQPVRNSDWITLVAAYENSDKIIDWYMPFFGKDIDSKFVYTDDDLKMIEQVKYWQSGTVYGDPSGKQRHIESKVSPYTILKRDYGITVTVNDRENDWPSRKDAAKRLMTHLRINDTPGTKWFIECVSSSRYPKRDEETSQATNAISRPVHDWTSHHRTQMEFFGVNYRPMTKPKPRPQKHYDPVTGRLLS
jgi:hypothetical protein